MIWMSLKNTVMALGKAYEKPMEMKEPKTTAQPQPPSGGATAGGPVDGGGMVELFNLHLDLENGWCASRSRVTLERRRKA